MALQGGRALQIQQIESQRRHSVQFSPISTWVTAAIGLAVFCLHTVVLPSPSFAQTFVPGTFKVNAMGGGVYSIPIEVPPGTADMKPSLSLEYDSQGGDGLVGMGWSLAGLPAVTRCPRTVAQDGVSGRVNYDSNDRYCLEGERLIAITGTYGANGTEYRTERDGFSKIISNGTAGNGPAWFKVWTKTGQIMEFGNTADSQILAQGKTTARLWAINKVSDTKSNYLTVTYTTDNTTNGEYRPSRIDYTGNASASLTPYASVQFVYATRPDITPLYQAGSLIKTTQRLTDIKTYVGTNLVFDYKLAYSQSPTTGRSDLTSVTLCASDGTCLPATTFTWQNENDALTVQSNIAGLDGSYANSNWHPYVGDFNGDGNADIFWTYVSGSTTYHVLWMNNRDGTYTVINNVAGRDGSYANSAWKVNVSDFNGDGKSDILWTYTNGSNVATRVLWFSNGDGTFNVVNNVAGQDNAYAASGWRYFLGDFNGDGKADIFWSYCSSTCTTTYHHLWLGNGDGTFSIITNVAGLDGSYTSSNYSISVGDFNGDGKSDILWAYTNNVSVSARFLWLSNGDGTFQVINNVAGQDNGYVINWRYTLGDFNGDGKTDIFWYYVSGSTTYRVLWVSNGDGTFNIINNLANLDGYYTSPNWQPNPGDFNGDGRSDVLWTYTDGSTLSYRVLWLSKGDGTFQVINNVAGLDNSYITNWQYLLGDFNGDGKSDIFWWFVLNSSAYRTIWKSDPTPREVIQSITSGLGAVTNNTYAPLSNGGTLYTKDNTAAYPVVDVQGPLYVVSQAQTSNGVGGNYISTYKYAGAKVDLSGRGFLGFRQMTANDSQTGISTTTTYRQDFPFVGLTSDRLKTLGAQNLNHAVNTYSCVNETANNSNCTGQAAGTRYFVNLSQSVESSWDLDGTAMPVVTTANQYDAYGDPTQVSVSTGDGYSKTTTNTYTNDTVNWFLGRLTRASVTNTTP